MRRGVGRLASQLCSTLGELVDPIFRLMEFESLPVAAKGVGQDDLCAGFDELAMQTQNLVGLVEIPKLRRLPGAKASKHVIGAGSPICQYDGLVIEKCCQGTLHWHNYRG